MKPLSWLLVMIAALAPWRLSAQNAASEISLSGEIDVRDILKAISDDAVTSLDLSQAVIKPYEAQHPLYLTYTTFRAHQLPPYIFFGSQLERVLLPASLTSIGEGAFAASALREISIPAQVTEIGPHAFAGAAQLTTVTASASLLAIGDGAFKNCAALKEVKGSLASLRSLGCDAFAGDALLSSLPEMPCLQSLGSNAFAATNVGTLQLPSLTQTGDFALSSVDGLVSADIGSCSMEAVGIFAFCPNLADANCSAGPLPDYTFAGCLALDNPGALHKVSAVGSYALAASGVKKVVLGPDVAAIGQSAFRDAHDLALIDVSLLADKIPAVEEDTFESLDTRSISLLVDKNHLQAWKDAPVWQNFNIMAGDPNGVDDIQAVASRVSVAASDGRLKVTSALPILEISATLLSGLAVHHSTPGTTELEIPVPAAADVLLLDITDQAERHIIKIIVR